MCLRYLVTFDVKIFFNAIDYFLWTCNSQIDAA